MTFEERMEQLKEDLREIQGLMQQNTDGSLDQVIQDSLDLYYEELNILQQDMKAASEGTLDEDLSDKGTYDDEVEEYAEEEEVEKLTSGYKFVPESEWDPRIYTDDYVYRKTLLNKEGAMKYFDELPAALDPVIKIVDKQKIVNGSIVNYQAYEVYILEYT